MYLTNLLNSSVELWTGLEKLPRVLELKEKMTTAPSNSHPSRVCINSRDLGPDYRGRWVVPSKSRHSCEGLAPNSASATPPLGDPRIHTPHPKMLFLPMKCSHCCCALLWFQRVKWGQVSLWLGDPCCTGGYKLPAYRFLVCFSKIYFSFDF